MIYLYVCVCVCVCVYVNEKEGEKNECSIVAKVRFEIDISSGRLRFPAASPAA